jgi:hypothetical protein
VIAARRCAAIIFLAVACSRPQPRIAIADVTIINPADGSRREHVTVVIRGDRIVDVTTARVAAERLIDGRGKFLLPGFWDMDARVQQAQELDAYIRAGVTGIRNTRGRLLQLQKWREEIVARKRSGPRMLIAGPALDGVSRVRRLNNSIQIEADDAGGVIGSFAESHADFITIADGLSRDAFFAVSAVAQRRRSPFSGRLPDSVTSIEASDAGMTAIEGLDGVDGSQVATLSQNGTWHIPAGVSIAPFRSAGLPLLTGTAGSGTVQDELVRFVAAGLSPMDALRTATSGAAQFLRRTDAGRIARDSAADLVLLNADPTVDIRNTSRVAATIVAGRVYGRF